MASPAASATFLTVTVMVPEGSGALGARVTVAVATSYAIFAGTTVLPGPLMTMLVELMVLMSAPSLNVMVMGAEGLRQVALGAGVTLLTRAEEHTSELPSRA